MKQNWIHTFRHYYGTPVDCGRCICMLTWQMYSITQLSPCCLLFLGQCSAYEVRWACMLLFNWLFWWHVSPVLSGRVVLLTLINSSHLAWATLISVHLSSPETQTKNICGSIILLNDNSTEPTYELPIRRPKPLPLSVANQDTVKQSTKESQDTLTDNNRGNSSL